MSPSTIDARGRRCPIPVIELAKLARTCASGDVVTVLADDPAAQVDIPAWARMRAHEFLRAEPADGGGTAYSVRLG